MQIIRPIAIAALAFSVACTPPTDSADSADAAGAPESAPAADSSIAAEINGVEITTDELDTWIKEDMFRQEASNPNALYELRENALQRMLAERALTSLADAAGVSVDELIAKKIADRGPVTDAEMLAFYEENKSRLGTADYESLKPQISDFLGSQREREARAELEAGGSVVVFLEPPRVNVAPTGPSMGPADASITIVEFSDFQCPYCKRVLPTIEEVLERYPNDVRVVFRNFPLGNHSRAKPAAAAALCAGRQDKFWPFHDLLFENARALGDEDLTRYASELELDTAAFEACLVDDTIAQQLQGDFEAGRAAGVTGTPAFFVNGVLLSGAKPSSDFFRTIDAELARLKSGA